MLDNHLARSLNRLRRYLAALLFETGCVSLLAAMRALHHGLLSKRLPHDAMQLTPILNRSAFFTALGTRLRRRRGNRL